MTSLREKAHSAKTLICLLQSLTGREIKIELRNDSHVIGTVVSVDAFMNVEMTGVTVKYDNESDDPNEVYEYLFVKGPRIRYVHIPDDVNVIKSIEQRLDVIQSVRRKLQKLS